jgi:gliding motility-associated-like protein
MRITSIFLGIAMCSFFGTSTAQVASPNFNATPTSVQSQNPNLLGTCAATCTPLNILNPTLTVNPKGGGNNQINNGNGTIATIYQNSACGLSYVLGEVKTGKRYSPAAANQPVSMNISGIPACFQIQKAYLYIGGSGNGIAFSSTLVNPAATSSVFPMTMIGNHIDKCWGYSGTYNYRADVTALISGNGNYVLSGVPTSISTPGNDMDGASLVIIYTDPSQSYEGNIVIGDGCQVNASTTGTLQNTLTGFNSCGNSTFAQCFYIISDLQNILATGCKMNSPAAYNFSYPAASNKWWDNIVGTANMVTTGQNSCLFGTTNTSDCYNIVTEGLYWRTNCNVCSAGGLTITTAVTSTCTAGSATAFVTGGNAPYSYTWTPSAANTSVITNVAPGNYTVTVKDATGCLTGTALAVIPASSTTLAVNSATICPGKSATLTAIGGNTYTWTPAASLNSANGNPVIATPAATTIYTVTGTNTLGCTGSAIATVVVSPLPVVAVNSPTVCVGSTFTLTATSGNAAYAWSGPNAYSSALQNPPFANAQTTLNGNYTVTVTSAAGCTNTGVGTVSVVPAPTVTVIGNNTLCSQNFNGSPATTTLTASGAASYQWSLPGGFSGSPSVNSNPIVITPPVISTSLVAFVTVIGTSGSCTNQAVYTLTVMPNPTITVTSGSMCAGTSVALTAANAQTYTWTPSATLNTANGPNVIASPAVTTVYSIIGSSVGCNSQAQNATANVVPNPTVTINPNPAVICIGNSINLTAGGATNYTWSPNIALTSTNTPNTSANPSVTTTYSVLGSQATCTNIASITVSVLPLPTVNIVASSPTICMNNFNGSPNTVTLTASGASSFTWTSIVGITTNTLNGSQIIGTSNGNAIISGSVIGANGTCTNVGTFNLNAIANPVLATTSGSMCAGTSVALTAANAQTYTWTPSATLNTANGPNVIASPAVTTVYSIIGSSVGCNSQTGNATAIVVNNPTVSIAPLTPTICFGSSIVLSAAGANNYTWSPNTAISSTVGANVTVSPTVTTTYQIIGEASTCTNTAARTVTVIPLPVINIALSSPTMCMNNFNGSINSITVTANGATTYNWTGFTGITANTNAGSPIFVTAIPNSPVGTGTVVGSVGTCTGGATFTVIAAPNPIISVPSVSVCQGKSVDIVASGAQTYQWSPPTSLSSTSGSTVTANPVQTTVYSVIGSSLNCQSPTQQTTVDVVANPVIVIIPITPTICAGSPIGLSAFGATNYTWSPNQDINTINGANVIVNPTVTTVYQVLGEAATCTSVAQRQVSVIPLPNLSAIVSPSVICEGDQANINANGANSYTWSPTYGLSSSNANFVIANPTVSMVYGLVGSNGICSRSISVILNVTPRPLLLLSTNNPKICKGASSTIFASGAMSYSWTPALSGNITNTTMATVSPSVTSSYTVTGYNAGCPFTKEIVIEVVQTITASISNSLEICEGESTRLSADGSNFYVWSPGSSLSNSLISQPYAEPKISTVYTVYVSDGGNCPVSATVFIQVNPIPTVSAGPDQILNSDEPMYLDAKGTGTLTWTFGDGILCHVCPNTQLTTNAGGTYKVQSLNEFGCKATDEMNIVITNDYSVYIPNIFTPNYDGKNETFLVYGVGISNISVTIFDRWGTELYHDDNQTKGWDGTFKDEICKNDVYVYMVKFTALDGKKHTKTGHVTLLK